MIGASMATLFCGNGIDTLIFARSEKSREKCLSTIKKYFGDLLGENLVTAAQAEKCLELIRFTSDYADFADCQLVAEAVFEDKDVKKEVYNSLEQHCSKDTIIGSATSSMPAGKLAELLEKKDRFLVMHPVNPTHLVPLIEIAVSSYTSEENIERTCEFFKYCGKTPIVIRKDIEGFIINRLQHALFREAVNLVEEGVCSAKEVNDAFFCSLGQRYASIGIFEHYDAAGVVLQQQVHDIIFPTLCSADKTQKPTLDRIEKGETGMSAGKGMLDWTEVDLDDFRYRQSAPFYKTFNYKLPK